MSSPLSHNVGEGAGGEGHPRHPNHLSATTRVNVLSALKPASGRGGKASQAFAFLLPTGLLSLALVTSHFVLLSGLLVGVGLLRSTRQQLGPLVVSLSAASGLILLGLQSGTWDYAAPLAGAGLNSLSFGLLLLALLLANGGVALVRGHPPQSDALFSLACCYLLLRLYSLGPWNLGWLLASLLLGAAVALAAAWQGAGAPSSATGAWQTAYLNGFILTGAGLGSEAGIVLAGYGLLLLPVVRLGFSAAPTPHWRYWLLCAALPLSAPFIMAWLAVAAALAGGLTLLAVSLWAAALLAALPVARLAHGQHQGQAQDEDSAAGRSAGQPHRGLHHYNILTGVGLSLATPFMLPGLLTPLAAQLQGGLTPFGSLELWPWAGLIAFNAARQPVATLPSIALIALMLILAALCWLGLRLRDRT
ncbi:MAG: hypothetical protein EI684_22310 [Candidatus Viridilinea halotolerans]|uniref:Uncharacterized protein n=1 Tax=Candidatus Viridilinea halotolerans TaxID=2491704 RepID=A0A426TQX0_9CHLR|nr:MAG: hypothetical protein EI684_22310 [Candidatus Viridilinea halotolerans]